MTVSPTPTEAEKVVAEWRAAMEGVPAGKWQMKDFDVELSIATMDGSAPLIADLVEQGDSQEPGYWGSEYQIGQWLARCSPSGISALLALIESQRATIERVGRERDEARERATSWEEQFHAAANAASAYSEFWERHVDDFDAAGNYIPHSQIDGDLRAAEARITALSEVVELYQAYGCPVCGGDCASANPPVMGCPSQLARQALSRSSTEVKNDDNANG